MDGYGWKPDRHSHIPMYRQIVNYIKDKIVCGEWKEGRKLPSQRALAEMWTVDRSTVLAALEQLKAEGLLVTKRGSGMQVAPATWHMLAAKKIPDWRKYVGSGQHKPNPEVVQNINQAEYQPGILRLGTGELAPELLPNKEMGKVIQRLPWEQKSFGYERPKGDEALRREVAVLLEKRGISTSPDNILIVSGALQALQLISIGLVERGTALLAERPSYLHSVNVFQSYGMHLYGVPMDDEGILTGRLSLYKHLHKAALLYTNPTFHNPTGALLSADRRQTMLQVCADERIPLIEDDVYADLWLDEPPPPAIKSWDRNGYVLYIGSVSKTLSPGLRIGWVIGPQSVIDRLADIKMQTDYGASSLSQWVVTEWLRSGRYDRHLKYVREQLRLRRAAALESLNRHMGDLANWQVPSGGFYIWTKIKSTFPAQKLFAQALQEGVLLNPGFLYDKSAERYLRLSYAYVSPEELDAGLAKLAGLVRRLSRKSPPK